MVETERRLGISLVSLAIRTFALHAGERVFGHGAELGPPSWFAASTDLS
jgi:hypothetical protein